MRNLPRLLALALCAALLALPAAMAEGAEGQAAASDTLAMLSVDAGEKVIPPQYAVPDYVVRLIE